MRFFVPLHIILLVLPVSPGLAQPVIFEDGFEDGEFTSNPVWTGDADDFTINNVDNNHLLQLNAESAGISYLSTSSTNTVGYWEFYINLDGFAPSGSNRAEVFLMSSVPDLDGSVDGYAVRAGENGSNDVFKIVRYDNGTVSNIILADTTSISNGGDFRVRVIRSNEGNWQMEVGAGYDGVLYYSGYSASDNTYNSASYFGVLADYTSTRSDKFFFDFKIDIPPLIVAEIIVNDSVVEVLLNRACDPISVQAQDFFINNGIGAPASVSIPEANIIRLNYASPLPGGRHTLTVQNIEDLNSEEINLTTISFIQFGNFNSGDVIINEFMYDPPTGAAEYVELKNTSDKYLDLKHWQLGDSNSSNNITGTTRALEPGGYLVISADTTTLFNTFGHRPYVKMSSFPALNNTGDAVWIVTSDGEIADSLTYAPGWGGTDMAMERRSGSVPALYAENWTDSPHPLGGTPGLPNEAEEDRHPPGLEDVHILNNQNLTLAFDERLENASASEVLHYSITGDPDISSATVLSADSVTLTLSSPLSNAITYTLTINQVEDIFGNAVTKLDTVFTYYEISAADPGDVFINEFMYDPPSGSSEYVEIYNVSSKSLDLQGWTLNDNTGQLRNISSSGFILPPDSMVVLAPDHTLLASYPDIALISMSSSFPSLNNNGDDIIIRNAGGILLDSLTYSPGWGGEASALERRTTSVPGIFSSNWNPAPDGLGTPGQKNKTGPDLTPPGISDFQILTNRSIRLAFNEIPDPGSAIESSNYSISGGISIDATQAFSENTVDLSLSSALQNASSYTLTIDGVKDIFGNTTTGVDTVFTYFEISPVDSGDVFVNEFMYEPPAGGSEYIELYNPSDKSLDLKGWTINDNTGNIRVITSEQTIVPPGSFVVIAPDNTLLMESPGIPLVTMGSNFPALNNSGDDIVIRDNNGQMLDSLRYTADWGGAEKALERRTTHVSAVWQENWNDVPGGTGSPGKPNATPQDDIAPEFEKLTILSDTSMYLEFSEKVDPASAVLKSSYILVPKRNIDHISIQRTAVILFLSQQLRSGQSYRVTVKDQQDIFGNAMHPATLEETYIRFASAQKNDVIINEILYTRKNGGDPEFIELYNPTDKNFNLSGWKLGDAAGTVMLDPGVQLRADGYVVLTDNAVFADSLNNVHYIEGFPSLNDAGDALYLQTDAGLTIDSLFYQSDWDDITKGMSLERKDPMAASNDPSNWQSHPTSASYSPGVENASLQPDKVPPEVIFSKFLSGGNIEVQFSEFIRLTPDLSFFMGEQQLYIESFNPDQGGEIILHPPSAKTNAGEAAVTLTAQNLTDVRGNLTPAAEIPVACQLKPSSVVINEIMYNPLSEPDDNLPDQSEYVELRNTEDYAVSLEGLYLHDSPDENGEVRSLVPVSTAAKWIPAQGITLIYADEAPVFGQSRLAGFFEIDNSNSASIIRIDRSTLSLASSGDAVYLADSTGAVIDSVYYDESWQNPNLIDTRGVALERINPSEPGNNRSNWSSSTSEKGGTPHAENTLYQMPGRTPDQAGINFTPNPFSPDNDGYDDNLFINYKLDEADYLMKVHIYDRYGRLVRKLADGQPAGFEGSLIWDGRKDNGTRNRIGIYIVVFEAFNSTNGKSRAFKKTVVLARRL